ncbi:TIGR03936 family radical SAM-associated protein [Tessaracoccus lacteus]|uniref:TIGR03936 family radical SAM-associated protein n=1 Tax=Tessaracoccus lacteus TaxID=3041766 RepID=A0ABY8PVE6_9ACTN|nr:TIGR03936 family radical SAM-associated protein [Tessaracoccus sp. T21]WGT46321.1 TIGR03936 family radical SAM-associated protein [Tessaracoccus sp. T21]
MGNRQPPVQQAPPAQKLRLRYAKRGPGRFTSHRDFGRALERALRRAEIPMAYSSGFNPHPRISYANAAPTSAASEAEYVELGLREVCDPAKIVAALNEVLPTGFVVLAAADAVKASLGDLLQASDWVLKVADAEPGVLAGAVAGLLARDEFPVERMTKNGLRSFDVRSAIISLEAADDETLRLRSIHQTPLVRPDDVMTALRMIDDRVPQQALLTRLVQGPLRDGEIGDPLS